MASPREIRRRIRSVRNIAKVTKAMETVAASKMRRAQQQVLSTRPYAERAWEMVTYLASVRTAGAEQPLLQQRPVNRIGLLLITGDRGLAGAYNGNVIRAAARQVQVWQSEEGREVSLVTVGRKGGDWMMRHGPAFQARFDGLGSRPTAGAVAPVARVLIDDFAAGVHDAVYIAFTKFVNTLRQEVVIRQLLPIVPQESTEDNPTDYIFEPNPDSILNVVLRDVTEMQILQAIYESIASEESARMVAMRSATDSANDLIGDLTLRYNKARQEAITSELIDITSGAAALAQSQ